jgi:hypothetical protein
MITVQFKGGMGNQMFQYSIGRIIAEAKGYKLEILDPDNRKELLFNNFPFVNTAGVVGKEIKDNTMAVAHDLQYMDMDAVLGHGGHVFLHGYWQKYYYYTPHKEKIQKWFDYPDDQYEKPEPEDVVMHVRLGDQLKPERIGLPETVQPFINVLNTIPHKRCILLSDEPDEPYLAPLRALPNVTVKHGTQMGDFTMLKYAKRAIISQSTYAWWATFLGNPDKVWAPLTASQQRALWKACPAVQDIDLIPLNDAYNIFKI